ncbi:conserved hypothetical protein [Ixodes scapularis]|uniref:Oligosaccharyltransferase complex subunit n=1 Tax=Ixodes scapularis TaxID=6945 RepID=B7PDY6_IXOSC|nr:conserved hypothetical protein [Ixodes scapularis]|eukprot:XP_002399545.1 conserved hypothetical protein [Ixodes scapularis]
MELLYSLPFYVLEVPNLKLKKPQWLHQPSAMVVYSLVLLSYFLVCGGIIYDVIVEPPSIGSTVDEHGHSKPVRLSNSCGFLWRGATCSAELIFIQSKCPWTALHAKWRGVFFLWDPSTNVVNESLSLLRATKTKIKKSAHAPSVTNENAQLYKFTTGKSIPTLCIDDILPKLKTIPFPPSRA